MPRRRATASLLLFLLLQMMGLGTGVLRAAGSGADCESAMAQETGSQMADMPMPASSPPSKSSDHGQRPPCGLPWAPLGCASAAACLPAFAPAERPDGSAPVTPRVGILAADVPTPESPTRAPELPPPRA